MLSHRNILFQLDYADFLATPREGDQQLSFLPLSPRRRADLHRLLSAPHRRHRELRREHRHRAREHPRGRPRGVLRGPAHLGEVLLGRGPAHAGGHVARPAGLPVGDRGRHAPGRGAHRRPSPVPVGAAGLPDRRPPGARQRQALARAAPGPRGGHRCGSHRPRPDPVVHGARHRHARGLRADRELRPGHGHAGRPDQARHGGGGPAGHRGATVAGRRDPPPRARTSSSATTRARPRRRRRSSTAGCTPGTWARSTPTASCGSPTG